MPNEDGFSLIEKPNAVNRKPQRNTPAIALTAQAGSSERIKILSAGFRTHLTKPIEPAELITVAYNFIDSAK